MVHLLVKHLNVYIFFMMQNVYLMNIQKYFLWIRPVDWRAAARTAQAAGGGPLPSLEGEEEVFKNGVKKTRQTKEYTLSRTVEQFSLLHSF